MIRKSSVTVVTASDGSATSYSAKISGRLHEIHYVKTDYADGVDFTITAETSGETLWTEANVNAAKVCRPRGATHSNAGVASLYAAGGTAVQAPMCLAAERVKIVLAAGGNVKTGQFLIFTED